MRRRAAAMESAMPRASLKRSLPRVGSPEPRTTRSPSQRERLRGSRRPARPVWVTKRKSGPSISIAVAEVMTFITLAGVRASDELWSTSTRPVFKSLIYMPMDVLSAPSMSRTAAGASRAGSSAASIMNMRRVIIVRFGRNNAAGRHSAQN